MPGGTTPGSTESAPEPPGELPHDDDRAAAAAQPEDEWAAADALLLGQPTVLGEPGSELR